MAILGRIQSIWRRNVRSTPPDTAPLSEHALSRVNETASDAKSATAVPPPVKRPSTRAQRLAADISTLRGDVRTLESKLDSIQSRCDRLDQSIGPIIPRSASSLEPLQAEIETLRSELQTMNARTESLEPLLSGLAQANEQLRSASSSIVERMQRQNDRITNSDERVEELARRIEHLQMAIQDGVGSIHETRDELIERDALRSRDLSARLVGLYLIAGIALTLSIATLIIVLSRVGV